MSRLASTSCRLETLAIGTFTATRTHFYQLVLVALAWCAVLCAPTLIAAQDIKNPQSAVDSRERSEAHVDPATLAMQLQIPLGQYLGRSGTATPITLNYSSKVWRIKHISTLQCGGNPPNTPEPDSIYHAKYAQTSTAGWTSSLEWAGGPSDHDPSLETYDGVSGQPAQSGTNLRQVLRRFISMPDGSRKEFRLDDGVHNPGTNTLGMYDSVDSSRIRYDSTTGSIYLPDGSHYESDASGLHYIDRNGNNLTFNTAGQLTDTTGRTFTNPLAGASTPGDVTYSLPGVGGTTLTYTLRWRYLKDPNTGASVLTDPSQPLYYMATARRALARTKQSARVSLPPPTIRTASLNSNSSTRSCSRRSYCRTGKPTPSLTTSTARSIRSSIRRAAPSRSSTTPSSRSMASLPMNYILRLIVASRSGSFIRTARTPSRRVGHIPLALKRPSYPTTRPERSLPRTAHIPRRSTTTRVTQA